MSVYGRLGLISDSWFHFRSSYKLAKYPELLRTKSNTFLLESFMAAFKKIYMSKIQNIQKIIR